MLRRSLIGMMLCVVLTGAVLAESPRSLWGSLAVCANCGARGGSVTWSYSYPTADQARQAVIDRLRDNDHQRHKILVTTSDRYIVVAYAESGSIGYEHGNDKDYALKIAARNCKQHWGNPVKYLIIDNVQGETIWGIVN